MRGEARRAPGGLNEFEERRCADGRRTEREAELERRRPRSITGSSAAGLADRETVVQAEAERLGARARSDHDGS